MAAYVELFMDQGADFKTVVNLTDELTNTNLNLTGYQVRSQMRRSYYSANAAATINCAVSDASTGEITMTVTAANTANIKAGRYLFDLEATDPNGFISRVLEGIITVTPEITK